MSNANIIEKPGQVVKITNPSHKFYGEEAVIQLTTPKTYRIRLLNNKKPFIERFIFANDRVNGMSSSQITMRILKPSVTVTVRMAAPLLNTWHNDTAILLNKYFDKTKEEIMKLK